jgi:hypothetical protein
MADNATYCMVLQLVKYQQSISPLKAPKKVARFALNKKVKNMRKRNNFYLWLALPSSD